MSLNNTTADVLGAAVASALLGLSQPQKENTTLVWQTIMRQIYAALKTDAVVAVTDVTGVTPGGGVSGPGTGTLT